MTDSFFASTTTTQRSESLNSFIQSVVSHHTSLLEFVTCYDDCLKKQRETKNICDFKSKYKNAKCVVVFHWSNRFIACIPKKFQLLLRRIES